MGELIQINPSNLSTPMERALIQQLQIMQENMLNLAMLFKETNARMQALESEVHRLVKVTNAQATEINAAIRQRAAEVCRMHRAEGREKAAAAAIRKSLKATCGTGTVRELPRCDFATALRLVQLWDDYAVMQAIKGRR